MNDACLGVFAKYWQPGHVKTRLAASIGDEKAAEVAHAMLAATIARFGDLAPRQVVAYSPDDDATREVFVGHEFAGWQCAPQADGDLGQRMNAFFQGELSAGAQSVVLLGSDTPNLPLQRVREALDSLQTHDVVLGPTDDGGYYLIGLSRDLPEIFDGMPWSTPNLWQATTDRLAELGASFQALQPWNDIDDISDLDRLRGQLTHSGGGDPALDRLGQHLAEILATQ